jgi:hypothetical protein
VKIVLTKFYPMISDFRRDVDVDDICALLGYYATLSGSSVPTFRDGPIHYISRFKMSMKKAFFLDFLSL